MTAKTRAVSRRRRLLGYAVGTVGSLALAALLMVLPGGLPVQILLMLTVVVASALIGGLPPAVVAALVSGLTLNVAFIGPTGSLTIDDPMSAVALAVYVVIGIAVASVVDHSARLAAQARLARAEADALADLALRLVQSNDSEEQVLEHARNTLGVHGAAIWRDGPHGSIVVEAASGEPPIASDYGVAERPIADGVTLVVSGPPIATAQQSLFAAYAAHLRVMRERRQAEAQAREAAELAEGNRIRTALLAAVSHDLRSPLAAIKAAASSLRSAEVAWSPEDEAELLATIDDGADRLERLVANLLDLTRLQTGTVVPMVSDIDVGALVGDALTGLEQAERVELDLPLRLTVRADPGLAERVIANLVDNAIKHGAGSPIRVTADLVVPAGGSRPRLPGLGWEAGAIVLRVIDHGPGVPVGDRGRLFQPFQRLGDAPADTGLGLGLAVALGLTQAMGGTLTAEDSAGSGLTMVLTLPAGHEEGEGP